MTSIKTIFCVASLVSVFALGTTALQAAEPQGRLTMKPLYGLSFDSGSKRAVGYFYAENGACKLVITLAGEPDWDQPEAFTYTRFEAKVAAKSATKFRHAGNVLEFFCEAGATAMSVTGVQQVASESIR